MVNYFSHCFGRSAGQNVLCSIIINFFIDHTTLSNSVLTKFSKGFFVGNCEGRDLVKILNHQLSKFEEMYKFKIICTNMINESTATMMGFCMGNEAECPDMVQISSRGNNICFLDNGHNISELEDQRMIINTSIYKFGTAVGSQEYILLRRFLEKTDIEICEAHQTPNELFNLLMGPFKMGDSIQKFLRKKMNDFEEKYPMMNIINGISEEDISNLLAYVENEIPLKSRLINVYKELDEATRKEMYEFCINLHNRAARMLAGVSFGVAKRITQMTGKNKLVLGLDGNAMQGMYGFKSEFIKSYKLLRDWNAKNDEDCAHIDVVFKDSSDMCVYYGVVGMAKHIWESHVENPKNAEQKIYTRDIL